MKRRGLAIFLLFFALWPAAHFALVRSYDIDPWKLGGWAMYSVPGPMKTVRVVGIKQDGELERLDFWRHTAEEQLLVDRFRELRRALGELRSPQRLAQGMFELHADWQGAVIAVLTFELDPETAQLRTREALSTWWRDGRREPYELPPDFHARLYLRP